MCPDTLGRKCATGCVATAMAQVMYHNRWPKKGTGSHSYHTNGGLNLYADFGSTTYKWDDMLPVYDGTASVAAENAVAELMYHCGVSLEMEYGPESGTPLYNVNKALKEHFGYGETAFYAMDYFSMAEWEDSLYKELSENRPVPYAGGNHAFVCDGYDGNGYYHFNWGWGGRLDGYFLLTNLNPEAQGIGSNSVGFTEKQTFVKGIMKASDNHREPPQLGVAGSSPVYRSSHKILKISKLQRKGGSKDRLFLLYLALRIGTLRGFRGF